MRESRIQNPESRIQIAFAADFKLMPHLLASIKSICYHHRNVTFYLLNKDYPDEWFNWLNNHLSKLDCEIINVKIELSLAEYNIPDLYTEASYYRFLLQNIAEGRILYLDCDVIVTKNLEEIYWTDFQGKYLAAVDDFIACYQPILGYANKLENSPPELRQLPYFNSGVMLINVDAWRENKIDKLLFRCADQYKNASLISPDQDILNAVLSGHWLSIPYSYNYQINFVELFYAYFAHHTELTSKFSEQCPAIIHYTYTNKPWTNQYYTIFREQYWFYANLEWCDLVQKWQ